MLASMDEVRAVEQQGLGIGGHACYTVEYGNGKADQAGTLKGSMRGGMREEVVGHGRMVALLQPVCT